MSNPINVKSVKVLYENGTEITLTDDPVKLGKLFMELTQSKTIDTKIEIPKPTFWQRIMNFFKL